MPDYTELRLADGTAVRFELGPGGAVAVPTQAGPGDLPDGRGDLPEGMGDAVPVGRGSAAARAFAVESLRTALRPLGPLLQEVHDAIAASDRPPREVNVTFGVEVGQDLKLGIVGAAGKAHMTVSATWGPEAAPGPAGEGAEQDTPAS
ncbi:CU044_2847 family protein [Actinacidiphila bryophytorum]|uniref:Trypsin-co-occurring domain-containing protein n=1 Tax=Actinacidiphila bryophytorum TaxID=1436133 RepID=A0A9W4H387_9ACTN|nr:CU044_2847 family protein [Actinacidiphila bryophytorum]MBM9438188.1 hypothetical protein [Actinacidiphila bryophytorum]MBN6544672.1 hypothetical protein [Actinacidiphila bryophytorum]CAG7647799.1 conserved hypothetical protein [Actinacidiphila bryophytorum]